MKRRDRSRNGTCCYQKIVQSWYSVTLFKSGLSLFRNWLEPAHVLAVEVLRCCRLKLHHSRRGNSHEAQAIHERPAHHCGRSQKKLLTCFVRFGEYVVLVVEIIELLRQLEGVFGRDDRVIWMGIFSASSRVRTTLDGCCRRCLVGVI